MVRILVKNQFAQLEGDFPRDAVDRATSYPVRGAAFTRLYQKKRADGTRLWDGRQRLLLPPANVFPAGLLDVVHRALTRADVPVEVGDLTHYPPPKHAAPVLRELPSGLRPYQREGIARAILQRRGILKIATGGGKTVLAAGLLAQLGLPALVLVDSKDLLHQTREVLERHLGRPTGAVGDGLWQEGELVVGTVATLATRLHEPRTRTLLRSRQALIADEVHHGASDSAFRVLMACPAPYRIGLSATPTGRSDNADLRTLGAIGPVIYEVSAEELIESGVLVRPVVEFVPIEAPLVPRGADYPTAYRLGVVESVPRNEIVARRAREFFVSGHQVLVLVREIEHGRRLLELLQTAGVPAELLCGLGLSAEARKEALGRFRSGALRCVVATEILDEAIDIPNIDALLLAGGGKSEIQTVQRIGRGMRTGKRATVLSVVDFADLTHRYLARHSLCRLETYQRERAIRIVYRGEPITDPREERA